MARRSDYLYRGAPPGATGDFLLGVPARHLYAEDVDALEPEAKKALLEHVKAGGGVYVDNRPKNGDKDAAKGSDDTAPRDGVPDNKEGEVADPSTPGQTDADQTAAGVSPDPAPPVLEDTQPTASDDSRVDGEQVAPGAVQSDHVVTG